MNAIIGAITRTIPITQFNRGLAGKIFEDVNCTGAKVVMKNNAPEVVIVPTEEYIREQEELENLRLWKIAVERFEHSDSASYVPIEEIDRKYGITEDDLANIDEVEFE